LAAQPFAIGNGTGGLLLGFLCWILAIGGVSQVAHDIEEEAKTGTLESLFLSHPGPCTLFLARNVAGLVVGIPSFLLVAVVLALSTSTGFHFTVDALVPV